MSHIPICYHTFMGDFLPIRAQKTVARALRLMQPLFIYRFITIV